VFTPTELQALKILLEELREKTRYETCDEIEIDAIPASDRITLMRAYHADEADEDLNEQNVQREVSASGLAQFFLEKIKNTIPSLRIVSETELLPSYEKLAGLGFTDVTETMNFGEPEHLHFFKVYEFPPMGFSCGSHYQYCLDAPSVIDFANAAERFIARLTQNDENPLARENDEEEDDYPLYYYEQVED
jgi:hypothetical protein